jgi:hypothetical protein
LGIIFCLPVITRIEYTMHKIRFIIIAETPRVMIISLKYGTAITESVFPVTAFRASIFCKKMKSKKATLQIMVNLEKKETTFIIHLPK